jgi:hypothetical protein
MPYNIYLQLYAEGDEDLVSLREDAPFLTGIAKINLDEVTLERQFIRPYRRGS